MQNEFEERFLRPIELNQKNIDDAKSNFDNVSNVWIADKDHGFIKATLARSISDKQVAVKIQDGKVSVCSFYLFYLLIIQIVCFSVGFCTWFSYFPFNFSLFPFNFSLIFLGNCN